MKIFASIGEFFVAHKFVSHHGNRFLTVYDKNGKHHNGQILHNGVFLVTVRKPNGAVVKVKHSQIVRVHRDHFRCLVKEKTAVHV